MMKLFYFRLVALFEHGCTIKLVSKMREMLMFHAKQNVKVYETMDDYVSQKFSPNVKLENVENLFVYFGAFLTLVLFVFVIDVLLSKQLRALRRRLVRGTVILWHRMIFGEALFPRRAVRLKAIRLRPEQTI